MLQWFEINDIEHETIRFVVIVTKYKGKFVIIRNKNRGGWEIPGGHREKGETLLATATRELYEETGATKFELEQFGIYQLNGSYGMIFYAEVYHFAELPEYEIEEIKFVEKYPEGLNFGEMYYILLDKWTDYDAKGSQKYTLTY